MHLLHDRAGIFASSMKFICDVNVLLQCFYCSVLLPVDQVFMVKLGNFYWLIF